MPPWLLLFDIDGTLLTTGGAGRVAFNSAASKLFGDHFTFDGIEFAGHLDRLIFDEAAARHGLDDHHLHHDSFRDTYVAELDAQLASRAHEVVVMPGVHDLLAALQTRAADGEPLVLGLLTGNYGASARLKLRSAGIDPDAFSIGAFGDQGACRADLVVVAMGQYERLTGRVASPGRTIVIGDTPRDVACAKAHGCLAVAVATGGYTASDLRAAGADLVMNDLRDPALLRLIGE